MVGFDFHRIQKDGVLEVCFYLPVPEVKKVFELGDDLSQLTGWFEAINSNDIEVSIIEHRKLGKSILVKRLHYIPIDMRNRWIGSPAVGTRDNAVLRYLLNRRIQETTDHGKADG